MSRTLLIVSILLALFLACDEEPTRSFIPDYDENLIGISQGLYGTILFWEGDFMPTYPEYPPGGYIYPVVRDVCIFDRVLYDDVEWSYVEIEPGIYAYLAVDVPASLIEVVKSDDNGHFEAELAPGMYSVFVREHGYYYANLVDNGGYVFPATVREGGTTEIEFDITYMATF